MWFTTWLILKKSNWKSPPSSNFGPKHLFFVWLSLRLGVLSPCSRPKFVPSFVIADCICPQNTFSNILVLTRLVLIGLLNLEQFLKKMWKPKKVLLLKVKDFRNGNICEREKKLWFEFPASFWFYTEINLFVENLLKKVEI